MQGIKLIIFDLDGTLVDAYPAIVNSFNYTMKRLSYPPQNNLVIRRAVGWGDANLLKPFIKREDLKRALFIYRNHHKRALLKGARLFSRTEQLLAYLRNQGYHLGIASNRPSRFSWIIIRHLRLGKYFEYVLCADRIKHGKPHPEILQRIMRRFKARPQETLYIGDMNIDAQAGRRAGIKTIIVTTGSSSKTQIKKEKPYQILKRIGELEKLL